MIITFADRKLKNYAHNISMAVRKMGPNRAKLFQQRLEDLADCESYNDLEFLPGHFHQLTDNRKGQWACYLDHPYRLIFEPSNKPVPIDDHGKYILVNIKSVEIIEITNYHKKG